jgi:hypothetical protein
MKILVPVIVVVLVIIVVLIMRATSRAGSKANRVLTLEQKLDVLASCGLRLADPFKPEDLLTSWGRADYEKPGYDLVLVALACPRNDRPGGITAPTCGISIRNVSRTMAPTNGSSSAWLR